VSSVSRTGAARTVVAIEGMTVTRDDARIRVTVAIGGRLVYDSAAPCRPECRCWWARLRRWMAR
jgi:hypothetical protein